MTDKELLELAAKACGISLSQWVDKGCWMNEPDEEGFQTPAPDFSRWNPLTDDGDRYRLARTLGFVVDFELHTVGVDIQGEPHLFQWGGKIDEAHAFVLAAAEIGKATAGEVT